MLTPLTNLTPEQREQAMRRFRIIQPFLEASVPLSQIAADHKETTRTLRRWVQRYQNDGLIGLARKGRADCGKRRCLSPEAQALVEGLALQKPPLSTATIYRQVSAWLRQRGEKPPSYDVIHEIKQSLPAPLTTLAHHGRKAYAQSFELVHRREASRSNAIWQADHTLLDILVLREGTEDPAKPWLTIIIDDYSRAIAGYFLSFDAPSAMQTSLALRQAIWRKEDARWQICGIPQILYTDHGSDFTSRHLEQVSADLKMQLIFSLPGQPRGRGRIERFFETLNQRLLCELPGYSPAKGVVRDAPTLTLRQLDQCLRDFLLDVYHQREHSDTKMLPQVRWASGGFLPHLPGSLEQLDLLLLTVPKARRVRADGLWFLGMRYIDPTLAAYVGEEVLLRYDPRDVAEVRVFHEGRFLCRAICQELAGETVPLKEIVRARNRRRKELRQTLEQRKRTVDTLLELRQWTPRPPNIPEEAQEAQPRSVPPQTPPLTRLKRYFNE